MGTFLMKLYTKKEKKLSGSFWEINILSEKLTTTTTTDESALEKLRCLSAGGAKKCIFWGYFGGPEGVFNDQTTPILLKVAFQLSSHPYLCTCEIRKPSDMTFLSLNPKYEKIILFFIFGGSRGALHRTQVNENFRALRPHNRADKFIKRKK